MRKALVATVAGLLSLTTAGIAGASPGQAPPPAPPARTGEATITPLTSTDRVESVKGSTSRLAESDPDLLARTDATPVRVVVKLDYDSMATYRGGLQGMPATSPAATGHPMTETEATSSPYAQHVAARESQVVANIRRAVPDAIVGRSLRVVYGGVALWLPANEAHRLLDVDGVVAVQSDDLRQPLSESPEFIGAPPVWDALGGQATAGAGVLFGSLDTGAWPEHPSYAANPDLPAAPLDTEGDPLTCNFGDDPTTPGTSDFVCNNKLVGGDVFLDSYFLDPDVPPEFYPDSARDSDGHGTHTSTTAAGGVVDESPIFGVDHGPISGVAPGAQIAVYKVCGEDGCAGTDSAAAVEQAIFDGVDVINFSISGGANPFQDVVELAFLDAYDAGIFVAASAGNSGPGAATTDHLSPWVTTVAASTQSREFQSTLHLVGDDDATVDLVGSSITRGVDDPTPVVLAQDVPGYDDEFCGDEPPADDTFDGLIVACERGGDIGRVQKGFNLNDGGAEGMILYNLPLQDTETDNHWLPTVHLADGTDFLAFLDDHGPVVATFTDGTTGEGQGDVMASFSSRGPGTDWLKPDITAPGVQILAGHTPTPQVLDVGPPGELFQAIAGTSMSSPHIAGSALLLYADHPDWSPGQVKSAIMTTATTDVVKEDEVTPADPFDMGAGRVQVDRAAEPGLTIADTAEHMAAVGLDPLTSIDVNIPSVNAPVMPGRVTTTRVVQNVGSGTAVYHVATTAPDGTSITVEPSVFTINAGATRTLTITIEAEPGVDGQQFGEIDLTAAGRNPLHLPVAFVPTQGSVSLTSNCAASDIEVGTPTSCAVTATNEGFSETTVDITSTVNDALTVTGATGAGATHDADSASVNTVHLAGREPGVPSLGAYGPLGSGYVPGIESVATPEAVGDEDALNFDVDPFVYNGVTYDRIGIVSDGYAVVGGVSSNAEIQCCPPQQIPDAAPPNNVLAPFWADLTGEGDDDPAPDGIYAATMDFGGGFTYTVFEFRLNAFGTDDLKVFQLWIGTYGVQDISFNYGDVSLDGITPSAVDPENGGLTIGAENELGDGEQIDEALEDDNLPPADLVVESSDPEPGDTVTMTVDVQGAEEGTGVLHSEMTSPAVIGTTVSEATVDVLPNTSDVQAFVARAYNDLLDRDPDPGGLAFWTEQITDGHISRRQFALFIARSPEYLSSLVSGLYSDLLDRGPDSGGLNFWVGQLQTGMSEAALVGNLVGSNEFFANSGSTVPNFVDDAYEAVLGRAADAAGKSFWVDQINGGASRTAVGRSLYDSLEKRHARVTALYNRFLLRDPDQGGLDFWSQQILTGGDVQLAAELIASQEYFDRVP